jgi:hypothetical protein
LMPAMGSMTTASRMFWVMWVSFARPKDRELRRKTRMPRHAAADLHAES